MSKRLLVFASGSATGGGSGFRELAENSRSGVLEGDIVGVISNHKGGGVEKIADEFGIPFSLLGRHSDSDFRDIGFYRQVVDAYKPDLVCLSGWLKQTVGFDPRTTINIHPGPLPNFGGTGFYGHHVHEAVIAAYKKGEIFCSAVSMHFVTEKYDEGPIFFRYPVLVRPEDDAGSLGSRVNKIEHGWQSYVTNEVLQGRIYWDGKDPESLVVPDYIPY